jgi:site-specific DNA recombinase
VLRVDACRRAGVAVLCLHRALGQSPEDALLLQVQGMIAEYERAKIIERHRRGTRHAARVGAVHVRSGAPYGSHDVPKDEGGDTPGMRASRTKRVWSVRSLTGSDPTA